MRKTIPRFLLAGGGASLVNWLARFGFSEFLPFAASVVAAYLMGMVVGFVLYRNWVFIDTVRPVSQQVVPFVAVNLFGLGAVALSAVGFAHSLRLTGLVDGHLAEGIGHLAAIAVGAVANYAGHRAITFSGSAEEG